MYLLLPTTLAADLSLLRYQFHSQGLSVAHLASLSCGSATQLTLQRWLKHVLSLQRLFAKCDNLTLARSTSPLTIRAISSLLLKWLWLFFIRVATNSPITWISRSTFIFHETKTRLLIDCYICRVGSRQAVPKYTYRKSSIKPPGGLIFFKHFWGEGLFNLAKRITCSKNTVVWDRVGLRVVQLKSLSKVFTALSTNMRTL